MKKVILLSLLAVIIISCSDKKSDKKDAETKATTQSTSSVNNKAEASNMPETSMDVNGGSTTSKELPVIDFDKREFLFGNVEEGEIVKGGFIIENKGTADLILTSVKASCGCTVPMYTKEPIKPGESGEIEFSFNTKGRAGTQSKSITVKSNAEKETEILRIKGVVEKKAS
jgi:hypothetical protein